VLKRYEINASQPKHIVVQYPYTIEEQSDFIRERLSRQKKVSFTELLEAMPERIAVVFNFLAILEMIQLRQLRITIGEGYNNFWIEKTDPSEE
jgi:segregation and condensation protein A